MGDILVSERGAVGVHHTATSEGGWDGPGNEARLRDDGDAAYYRRAFAWGPDPEKDADTKAAWRFIHHEVSGGGDVGEANLTAASTGIGVLNGGRGGTTIPAGDRQGVWNHLAAHLRDGEREPPELQRSLGPVQRRAWPLQELRVSQEDGIPRVDWYAAVFDSLSEDLGGFRERIGRRAFTRTIQADDIRALFNHNPDLVLGRNRAGTLELHADLHGLRAMVTPPDTQWGRDLLVSIERRDITGGSFGFLALEDRWTSEEDGGIVREVREAKLFDVSLVTYPAYPATDGAAIRSALVGAGIELEDLTGPLLRARAGLAVGPAEIVRFRATIGELERAVDPESRKGLGPIARRRSLELLRLKGG